jgi:hypothetical protein
MLEAALEYARNGIPVFPCREKKPLTPHGFKDASCDERQVQALWELFPDAQIAAPTGTFLSLDLDTPAAALRLEQLEEEFGALPTTRHIRTSPGRRQIHFLIPEGAVTRSLTNFLGVNGFDIRGSGGYTVLPPSIHHKSGKPYEIIIDEPMAAAPWWLLRLIAEWRPPTASTSNNGDGEKVREGSRNSRLASLAGTMWRKGMTQTAVLSAMLQENATHHDPPLPKAEVEAVVKSICKYPPGQVEEKTPDEEEIIPEQKFPPFPEIAWRGVFGRYRDAMLRSTEASDSFHFMTLWARAAVALGRNVHVEAGTQLFPNVFLCIYGRSGDRKTTAARKVSELGGEFKTIHGGGSGEGLADEFVGVAPGAAILIYCEEFSAILRPGAWQGASLIPFLVTTFDCPPRHSAKFRKQPIEIQEPTPSLLACTTSAWFWRDFKISDFLGGFGGRIFFATGESKPPIPRPSLPFLAHISADVAGLKNITPYEAEFDSEAGAIWDQFYYKWDKEERVRDATLVASVRRIPSYVQKLAMVYAAFEQTLPTITAAQLEAAIAVGKYGEACCTELLALQHAGDTPRKQLEKRILAAVCAKPQTTRRNVYRACARHYANAEDFDRAFRSLERAGELYTKPGFQGRVYVSRNPLD